MWATHPKCIDNMGQKPPPTITPAVGNYFETRPKGVPHRTGGGFIFFIKKISPLFGEMIQFEEHIFLTNLSLQPPTRKVFFSNKEEQNNNKLERALGEDVDQGWGWQCIETLT